MEYTADFQIEIRIVQKNVVGFVGKDEEQASSGSEKEGAERDHIQDAGGACSVEMNLIQYQKERQEA